MKYQIVLSPSSTENKSYIIGSLDWIEQIDLNTIFFVKPTLKIKSIASEI